MATLSQRANLNRSYQKTREKGICSACRNKKAVKSIYCRNCHTKLLKSQAKSRKNKLKWKKQIIN